MANTILDRIIDDIVTQLQSISTGNGYETDVESVYEPETVKGYTKPPMKSFQIQLTVVDPERNEDIDLQSNPPRIGWTQPIETALIYRPSDSSSTEIRRVLNKFWADVIKAVQADPYRGDLAIDTRVTDPAWFINDADGYVGISCFIQLIYRHKENNPYEQ